MDHFRLLSITMPPKQYSKADVAKRVKVVEDNTLGLKNNNKRKHVQKYVHILKQSMQPKPDPKVNTSKVIFSPIFFRVYGA